VPKEDFVQKLKDLEVCSEKKAAKVFDCLKRDYEHYLDFNSFHKGFKYSTLLDQSKSFELGRPAIQGLQSAFAKDPRRPLSQAYLRQVEREPAGKRVQHSSYLDRVQAERLRDIESMLQDRWIKTDLQQSETHIKYRLARGGPVLPSAKVLSVYKSYTQDRSTK